MQNNVYQCSRESCSCNDVSASFLVTVWSVTVVFNLMVFNIIIWLISPYRLQFPHTDYSHTALSVTECAASGSWHPPGVNTFDSHCPFPLKLQFLSVLTEPEEASWSRPWTCKLYIHMYVHGRDWLSSHAPHSNVLSPTKRPLLPQTGPEAQPHQWRPWIRRWAQRWRSWSWRRRWVCWPWSSTKRSSPSSPWSGTPKVGPAWARSAWAWAAHSGRRSRRCGPAPRGSPADPLWPRRAARY